MSTIYIVHEIREREKLIRKKELKVANQLIRGLFSELFKLSYLGKGDGRLTFLTYSS